MYDGSKSGWKEDDVCAPVNHYGKTKLEAENLIKVTTMLQIPTLSTLGAPVQVAELCDFAIELDLWAQVKETI